MSLELTLPNEKFNELYDLYHRTQQGTEFTKVPIESLRRLLEDHAKVIGDQRFKEDYYHLVELIDNVRAGSKFVNIVPDQLIQLLMAHSTSLQHIDYKENYDENAY